MRFLTGLCAGALLVALALATPETRSDWLDRARTLVQEAVAVVRARWPDAVTASSPGHGVAAPAAAREGPEAADAPDPPASAEVTPRAAPAEASPGADTGVIRPWPGPAALPEAFSEDYAWWVESVAAVDAEAVEGPGAQGSRAGTVAAMEPAPRGERGPAGSGSAGSGSAGSGPAGSGPAEVARASSGAPVTVPERVAPVWIPFHSERSAAGFAERLGRALERPFAVEREGPGSYQVVFPYAEEQDRQQVLARVASLTGMQP